jgi:uncharacterized membrane protein
MRRDRLEAFSDGVLAIIITIMVLELKVPEGHDFADLWPLAPRFASYVLSFVYVGIYWNNHHHLMHTVEHVTGPMLWANTFVLFWLSLIPVTTDWVGESHFAPAPLALYGCVLLMAALAWMILERLIVVAHGRSSILAQALRRHYKEIASVVAYATAIAICWSLPAASILLYAGVAMLWLVPDRRIERRLAARKED